VRPIGKHGHAVKRQHGFFAGNARIAVLPSATSAELGAFLKDNVAAQSHLLTDGSLTHRRLESRETEARLCVAVARGPPAETFMQVSV
jgi:hypothetical protein